LCGWHVGRLPRRSTWRRRLSRSWSSLSPTRRSGPTTHGSRGRGGRCRLRRRRRSLHLGSGRGFWRLGHSGLLYRRRRRGFWLLRLQLRRRYWLLCRRGLYWDWLGPGASGGGSLQLWTFFRNWGTRRRRGGWFCWSCCWLLGPLLEDWELGLGLLLFDSTEYVLLPGSGHAEHGALSCGWRLLHAIGVQADELAYLLGRVADLGQVAEYLLLEWG